MIGRKWHKVAAAVLASLGLLFMMSSYLFCTSHYAEEGLQGLFTGDDAAIVALFALAATVLMGLAIAAVWRGHTALKRWLQYVLIGILLMSTCQSVLIISVHSCVSLMGLIRGSHGLMMISPGS